MTQFTLNDLAVRVLRDLNIIDADTPPSASDLNFVKETIRSEFALMLADGITMDGTTVDSINEIYFTELSRRMGFAIGPTFGIFNAQVAEDGISKSENTIRRIGAPVKFPQVLTIERAARGTRIRDPIITQ